MTRNSAPAGPAPCGVLVVDKESGPTSHDIVDRVRRALGTRRVGHAGTLDPLATGVLVCCVGPATRVVRWLAASDKSYTGLIRLGAATDTGDAAGQVVAEGPVPELSAPTLVAALGQLDGALAQVPPMYSAKKLAGQSLHSLARKGIVVERAAVPIRVQGFEAQPVPGSPELLAFRLTCSAGTYVRVLAEDLGGLLGVPAHLASLRRTAAGSFRVEDALPSAELTPETARAALQPLESVELPLRSVGLHEAGALDSFRHGRRLGPGDVVGGPAAGESATDGEDVAVRDAGGLLLGMAHRDPDGGLRPTVVLEGA